MKRLLLAAVLLLGLTACSRPEPSMGRIRYRDVLCNIDLGVVMTEQGMVLLVFPPDGDKPAGRITIPWDKDVQEAISKAKENTEGK